MTEQAAEFVQLKGFDDYEILSVYPFTIRRKDNHHEVSESDYRRNGYISVYLNCKMYLKHRLIALQFVPNDDPINKDVVDHINHNRSDNHIDNLRWVSISNNQFNRISTRGVQYEFVDDIPDDAMMIDYYESRTQRHEFEEQKYYYYHDDESNEDIFYSKITDNIYKILYINRVKSGTKYINTKDNKGNYVKLIINRFKFQHNLIE